MSDTKTPRTDEARQPFTDTFGNRYDVVPAHLSAKLETELQAIEKQNQDLREALAEYGYIVSFLKGAASRHLMNPSHSNEKELRAAIGTNLTLPPQAASEQEGA